MADEIRASGGMTVEKSTLKLTIPSRTTVATLAGDKFIRNCQAVGTTYEAIVVGDLGSAGWAMFTNLDATNYVEIGRDVGAAFYGVIRVNAGETVGPVRLSTGVTLYARANTATVNLDYTITEA